MAAMPEKVARVTMQKDPKKDCKHVTRYVAPKGSDSPIDNVYVNKAWSDGKLPLTITLELGIEVEL